jgi:hypothetical protein
MEELSCCLTEWFWQQRQEKPIILKAIVDENLYIWHIFFGLRSSKNDLNVLYHLFLVHNIFSSVVYNMTFDVNGKQYNLYYLFVNKIHP